MATVPGDPNDTGPDPYGGIPPGLRPGYPELLMAAAIHKQQQDQQKLAGDVIPFKKPPLDLTGDPKQLDEFNKMMTRDTLSRALGGGAKVLPMTPPTPGKTSQADDGTKVAMQFKALDPGDDGLITPGNIDLHNRPVVHNPDGSISTVRSITTTDDQGRAILIPTVIGNRVVSDKEAIKEYRRTGKHLGIFSTEDAADAYAQSLHESQAQEYGAKRKGR